VLAIAPQERSAGIERGVRTNRHEYVLQWTPTTQVQMHVVRGDNRDAAFPCQPLEGAQLLLGALAKGALQLDGQMRAESLQQLVSARASDNRIRAA
jgi:hypothetical protein